MTTMRILVTGSSSLIGSEAVEHFDRKGHKVTDVDNNIHLRAMKTAGARSD
jgi:NAD(P)-dependent dehydrogenase (short-subunit alcohol dehydrogenase family)